MTTTAARRVVRVLLEGTAPLETRGLAAELVALLATLDLCPRTLLTLRLLVEQDRRLRDLRAGRLDLHYSEHHIRPTLHEEWREIHLETPRG